MLVHCFWLLEFKFAFEFNCLIFSLNISKFRSLEKAPDLSLLEAQPSDRGPSAEVRRSPLDFSASLARRRSFGPAAAQQQPASRAGPRRAFLRSPSLTGGTHMSSPPLSRTRARVRVPAASVAAPRSTCLARTPRRGPSALFKEPPPPGIAHALKP